MASSSSPLKQVNVAVSELRPKAVSLYQQLFVVETHPPGFWVEFFLLPVSPSALSDELAKPSKARLLETCVVLQTLVRGAIANIGANDPYIVENALTILQIVIHHLAMERSLNSTELLTLLAGIDRAADVLDSLTDNILKVIRDIDMKESVRIAAIKFVLVVAASSAHTSLAPIFAQKNFFSAFITIIDRNTQFEPDNSGAVNTNIESELAFLAIGVLASLGTFDDGIDVYRQRISEYVDESVLEKMVGILRLPLADTVFEYHTAINAARASASNGHWLMFWRRPPQSPNLSAPSSPNPAASSAPASPNPASPNLSNASNASNGQSEHRVSPKFVQISTPLLCYLLPIYEFCILNDMFALKLCGHTDVFANVVELGSHLLSNSHKSSHIHCYARSLVLVFRRLVEDKQCFQALLKNIAVLPISQQRDPALSQESGRRPLLTAILDVCQCGLRFNVGKGMDLVLYDLLLVTIYQVLAQLASQSVQLAYNWPQLWQTLWSLTKYYHNSTLLLEILAGCVLRRDLFDEEDWEALYYRTVHPRESLDEMASPKGWALSMLTGMKAQFDLLTSQNSDGNHTQVVMKQGMHYARGHTPLVPKKTLVEADEQRFLRRMAQAAFVDVVSIAIVQPKKL